MTITWFNQDVLHVEITGQRPVQYPLLANARPELQDELSVAQIVQAIDSNYQQGYEANASIEEELNGIVFGGQGDPLLQPDLLVAAVEEFKLHRHGVPVAVATFGLVNEPDMTLLAADLANAGVETLRVFLPAANPPAYARLLQAEPVLFSHLCQFIEVCVAADLRVECFTHADLQASAGECRALALALGAVSFEVRELASTAAN